MTMLTDAQAGTILQSYDFFPGSNYAVQGIETAPAPRALTVDEFLLAIPFETYDRDPLSNVSPSRTMTVTSGAPVAYFPSASQTGAGFYTSSTGEPELSLDVQSVDATYEAAAFARLGAYVDMDRLQQRLTSIGGALSRGPDLRDTLLRLAKLAVVRQLGRALVTGSDASFRGLAKYYDGLYILPSGSDPQVIKANAGTTAGLLASDVRRLLRQVAPSGAGLGCGANALVMSRRTRDRLLTDAAAVNMPVEFRPAANGEMRYHFNGVPVYLAPLRDDEDTAGTVPTYSSPQTFNASSIYAMRLGGPTGVRVLHMGGETAQYGLSVEEVTPTGTSSNTNITRFKVHGYFALFIPERQAAARLFAVDITSEA